MSPVTLSTCSSEYSIVHLALSSLGGPAVSLGIQVNSLGLPSCSHCPCSRIPRTSSLPCSIRVPRPADQLTALFHQSAASRGPAHCPVPSERRVPRTSSTALDLPLC